MATIIDQVTLRAGVADWLNRSDLTDAKIDDFIAIGNATIYEQLRIPPLEVIQSFAVTTSNSSIVIPSGFLEMIELKLDNADKDLTKILSRVDSKTFSNNRISHAYTRQGNNFLLTDENGEQKAGGTFIMTFFRAEDSVGSYPLPSVTAGNFIVGKYYQIKTVGTTSFTSIGAASNTVDVKFKATGVGSGTGTAHQEFIPYILTEFEIILYAACHAASVYLGDIEMSMKFKELMQTKINSLNQKEVRASMKGGGFASRFSSPLL